MKEQTDQELILSLISEIDTLMKERVDIGLQLKQAYINRELGKHVDEDWLFSAEKANKIKGCQIKSISEEIHLLKKHYQLETTRIRKNKWLGIYGKLIDKCNNRYCGFSIDDAWQVRKRDTEIRDYLISRMMRVGDQ